MSRLILASQSPRRIELMKLITEDFTVCPSAFDEASITEPDPIKLVMALSQGKAETIESPPDSTVIGCDTVVVKDGLIFGKPADIRDARRMLQALSGGEHSVITGVCIRYREELIRFTAETIVTFYPLGEEEIEDYIRTEEPYDKAGGYGIQAHGGLFVERIQGDYNNVVGMPLSMLYRALHKIGAI